MAYNTQTIIKDINEKPVPQFYNPSTDQYEVLEGRDGASKVREIDRLGNEKTITFYLNSGDTKPAGNLIKGDVIFEIDTTDIYMWNGTQWVVI